MSNTVFNDINVIKHDIPYSSVVDFIDFVVSNSYGKEDGMYHEYLMDYSEAIAIITMYTDYDGENFAFDNVMNFIQSEKWNNIKSELGNEYYRFHYYVVKEIEYLNAPFRNIDSVVKKIGEVSDNVNKLISVIDVESIKNYDFSKIVKAIDAIEM